ncbi:hypothetical protein [Streptomyces sp. Act143]|nr:hypothetical protein [Streptomyces sp. Act143]
MLAALGERGTPPPADQVEDRPAGADVVDSCALAHRAAAAR